MMLGTGSRRGDDRLIRRYSTILRLGLLAADALSAFVLFLILSMVQFGDRWISAWQAAGFDPLILAAIYAAA